MPSRRIEWEQWPTQAVDIRNFLFDPASVTIGVGGKVTWTNHGTVNHTVTSD